MSDPNASVAQEVMTLELEKIKISAAATFDRHGYRAMARNLVVQAREDTWGNLVMQLETYILASKGRVVERVERIPDGWWQHTRERWFPRWWLKRRPVRWRGIETKVTTYGAMCPHLDYAGRNPEVAHLAFLGGHEAGRWRWDQHGRFEE